MIEDRPERRMYRKSPGRQYGYEYDPLHSQRLRRYGQQAQSDVSVQSQSWEDYDEYEEYDPLANRLPYTESPRARSTALRVQPEIPERGRRYSAPLDYDVEEQEEVPARRKQKKKKGLTRRKLLIGAVAVGGGAVAAYELVPHLPQALEQAGTNIEHQLQDAFNKGLAAGGEAVRKELINSLDTLEGVSLDAAIGAARLTRVAYDVFVSPLVTLPPPP